MALLILQDAERMQITGLRHPRATVILNGQRRPRKRIIGEQTHSIPEDPIDDLFCRKGSRLPRAPSPQHGKLLIPCWNWILQFSNRLKKEGQQSQLSRTNSLAHPATAAQRI